MGVINYINIDKIIYIGGYEYGIGVGNDFIFSERELKNNIHYPDFRKNLTQFTRFLKIRKITNVDTDDKFIGKVIYNKPFFNTYDMVSSPSYRDAVLRPMYSPKYIEVKITIEKVGILKRLYYLCKSFLELKTRWWAQLLTKK